MGLNPPFGLKAILANKLINKALTFKPKLIEYYTKVPGIGALPFVLAHVGAGGTVHRAHVLFKWGPRGPDTVHWAHILFKWARLLFKWGPRGPVYYSVGPAYKIYLIIFHIKNNIILYTAFTYSSPTVCILLSGGPHHLGPMHI